MNAISLINHISTVKNGAPASKSVIESALSILYSHAPKNMNGKAHAERIGLTLAMHGQDKLADKVLQISRSIPPEYADILLVVLLSADLPKLIRSPGPKRDPVGAPITSILDNISAMKDIGQRASATAHPVRKVPKVQKKKPEPTFEEFIQKRFGDIRSENVLFVDKVATPKMIQSLLSGKATDVSDVIDGKIQQLKSARFEFHTLKSTQVLLDKFIEIGNWRIELRQLLRKDSLSYEIRKHLVKFDAYVSVLSDNSPAAILTKIKPFGQVFQWLCKILSFPSFSMVHKELLMSSQTHFKRDLSLRLWAAAFEEESRLIFYHAFAITDHPSPIFDGVLAPIQNDCMAAGKFLRVLYDAVPSHPIFELAEEYMDKFVNLQCVIKEYEYKCTKAIKKIENQWIRYYQKQKDAKLRKFNAENDRIRSILREEEMEHLLRQANLEERKKERLNKLQKELNEYDVRKRKREAEEKAADKEYIDELVARNAVTPFFRPVTEEEKKLIELEKLDMFREFQEQMRELGASEEQIMKFFPDLNLPEDELEALGKEYEPKPEEEVIMETLEKLPPASPIRFDDEIRDELKNIAGFALGQGLHFSSDSQDESDKESFVDSAMPPRLHEESLDSPGGGEEIGKYDGHEQREDVHVEPSDEEESVQKENAVVEDALQQESSESSDKEDPVEQEEEEENPNETVPVSENAQGLKTIPALFHRLIIPVFKLQHQLVSKAVFSILKYRSHLPEQLKALSSLFLVIPSPHMDGFLKQFTAIPYTDQSFILISRAFKASAEALGLDAEVTIGQATDPPTSVAEILDRINHMPIDVKMNPIFSLMLPDRILECYVTIFRILILLKLSRAAVDKLWYLTRDSYTHNPDMKACSFMSRFVVATETYFYNIALAPTAKALTEICDGVETIDECNEKHEKALITLMKMAMVTANTAAIRTPLLQSLVEICRYAFGPLMMEKNIRPISFLSSANKLATIVHELSIAMTDNQTFKFLDTLFASFIQN